MDRVDVVHAAAGTVVVLERRLAIDGAGEPASDGVFGGPALGRTGS
jgi:hypothetical protein